MGHAKCVEIECRNAQYAEKQWKEEFFCIKLQAYALLLWVPCNLNYHLLVNDIPI